MENTEKIINKIKKVLELSKNNPSEKEAQAAALKAQKLMVEYHISMEEVSGIEDSENISEECTNVGTGNKWKYRLSTIIARNFRCNIFIMENPMLYFMDTKQMQKLQQKLSSIFLIWVINQQLNFAIRRKRNVKECKEIGISFYGKGIKNCFLIGFLDGIAEILEKQCTALMIVTPKEVEEAFKERTKDCKTTKNRLNTRSYYAKESWEEGKCSGKNAIGSRQLAMAQKVGGKNESQNNYEIISVSH